MDPPPAVAVPSRPWYRWAVSLLAAAPWRYGPVLLLRRPSVAFALAAAAFVATVPVASAGPFLSASRSAVLHHQEANTCAEKVAEHVESVVDFRGLRSDRTPFGYSQAASGPAAARAAYAARHRAALAAASGIQWLTAPVTTLRAVTVQRPAGSAAPFADNKFWLVGRSDAFAAHLHVLSGPSGTGVWLPDTYASQEGLRVGDWIELATMQLSPGLQRVAVDPAAAPARLKVSAIFTDLASLPDQAYWCVLRDTYRPPPSNEAVLPVAFVDLDSFAGVAVASPMNKAAEFLDVTLANPRLTNPAAHAVAARIAALRAALEASGASASWNGRPRYISALATDADRADLVRSTLIGTVVPAALAGTLIGLLLVAAAAGFWVQRRHAELRLLAVRGAGTAALGVKAAAETAAALTAGVLAGGAAAWWLVITIGPSDVLSGEARPEALAAVAGCVIAGLAATTAVAVAGARSLTDGTPARRRGAAPRLPWELVPLAAAALLWWALGNANEAADVAGGVGAVAHIPVRLVVVPIMCFAGVAALAARLGAWWLRARSGRRYPRRTHSYLALRWMGRPALAAATLGAATALPVALAVFAATVADSTRLTLHAKAAMVLGAETVVTLDRPVPVPAGLSGRATEVLRINGLRVGDYQVDVLGVDAATFARGAYWNAQLPGPSLAALAGTVHGGPDATAVGYGTLPAGAQVIRSGGHAVATVGMRTAALLPGAQGGYPVLLVSRDALGPVAQRTEPQLWISGDPATALAAIERAHLPVTRVEHPDDSYAGSIFEPITYTFRYLVSLATFAGLVASVGLLLYLEARTPAQRRAYVLLRRMGLRPGTHLAALWTGITVPVAAGFAAGLLLAAAMVRVGLGDLDLNPTSPPGPLVVVPVPLVIAFAVGALAVAVGAALVAHLRIGAASPGVVLRDSG